MTKKMITRTDRVCLNNSNILDVIEELQCFVDTFGNDCRLRIEYVEDYYGSFDIECKVESKSLEKEDEYQHRIAMEALQKGILKQKELAQLKALQEKYKGEI